jgi:beta-lactamase superfamily II metal-dependent hydrolase
MIAISTIHRSVGAGLAISVALLSVGTVVSGQTPAQIPPWTPGTLDIHHIATGQGNSTFFVFPDGTTMLVDAGAPTPPGSVPIAPPMPDGSRRTGEWISRYVTRMSPSGRDPGIDYALLTHFHADHMGFISDHSPPSIHGDYQLAGITDIAEDVPVFRLIDRGWPDYDYPEPLDNPSIINYRRFLEARQRADGLIIERFDVGRSDQIQLVRDPARYPTFEIRNLHANGDVWTGTGDAVARIVPPLETVPKEDWPIENHCSVAFLLRYGPFSYYTGGDLQGVPPDGYPAWADQETPIARAIGGPVDVVVIGHHGSIEPANAFFLATLRPRVDVVPAWSKTHPAPVVLKRLLNKRIYADPRDIFVLEFRDETKAAIGSRAEQVASDHGHVVVRVAPGGASYQVFVLDNRTESYAVLKTHGPYISGREGSVSTTGFEVPTR